LSGIFLVQLTSYPLKNFAVLLCIVGFVLVQVGCQRQAYTDFYTESMAGEIRELENRIYEYDDAYRSIEEELSILESENERLHQELAGMNAAFSKRNSNSQGSFLKSFGSGAADGEIIRPAPVHESERPLSIPSVDHLPPPQRSTPKLAPPIESKAAPSSSTPTLPSKSSPSTNKPKSSVEPSIPLIDPGTKTETLPKALLQKTENTILPPSNATSTPSPKTPSPLQPPSGGIEAIPFSPSPAPSPSPGSGTSVPSKSKDTLVSQASANLPSDLDPQSVATSRIEMPQIVVPASHANVSSMGSKPSADRKVVEIGFHPTLCRGQNLNKEEGDDGLYLVLQPRNQSGEFVDQPADVTIVAMDPKRPEGEARIGRWTLTAEELEAALEPIGISHGFHVSIPWQADAPLGDVVQVHVRYEMKDGRRLINERRVQLHVPSTASNVWTPRVAK
jgi:hypothetical protein